MKLENLMETQKIQDMFTCKVSPIIQVNITHVSFAIL